MEITVPVNADLRVAPTGFHFHRDNWNVAQTVRVLSLSDADLLNDTVILTHAFSGGDYNGIAVDDVSVTITEATSAGMSVESVRGAEGSGSLEFAVTLDQAITTTATVQYGTVGMEGNNGITANPGEDYTNTSGTLTFAPGETRKIVLVNLVDDARNEGEEFFEFVLEDPTNGELPQPTPTIRTVQGIIEDDDPLPVLSLAGTTVDGWSYGNEMAGPLTYTVHLNAASGREVMVDYATGDHAPGTRSQGLPTATATEDYVPLSGTLTFLPGETKKALTVVVNDDEKYEDDEIFAMQLSNPHYAVLSNQGWGVIQDEDVPGLVLTPLSLTVPEGGASTYTVVVTSQPAAPLTVTLSTNGSPDVTVSPSPLTFTTTDWNVAQTVTVTAVDDNFDESASETATISHAVASADSDYAGVSAPSLDVTIIDNDTVGVTIAPSELTVSEGMTAMYTVVLDTEPAGNVTVTIQDPADNTDVTADPASLTFTDQNWDTAQTVTVSAAEDDNADDETATITHTVASTADTAYEDISTEDVEVMVEDDETLSTEVILTVDPAWADEGTALTDVRLTAELNEASAF